MRHAHPCGAFCRIGYEVSYTIQKEIVPVRGNGLFSFANIVAQMGKIVL